MNRRQIGMFILENAWIAMCYLQDLEITALKGYSFIVPV